jgi:hypothetical protein
MSNIEFTAYTPASIKFIRFRIPLYQRPYTWEVFQIEQLLKDLYGQFEENPNKKYYIGILNIGSTEQRDVYDLIDGQQRITTLCLIGSVLKSSYVYWNDFLHNRLNLYGRTEDQLFLEGHEPSCQTNRRMVDAVIFIKKYIDDKLGEKSDAFSEYLFKNASFFISKVPDHYSLIDKNLQFVRMNNRGKQLEAHDVLKIKLAVEIIDETKRSEFIKNWSVFSQLGCGKTTDETVNYKSIFELLKSNDSNQTLDKDSEIFYQSIVSYPEFLLIALSRFFNKKKADIAVSQSKEKSDEENKKHKLIEEFGFGEKKIEFDWSEENVLEFGYILSQQFNLFNKYIIKRDKDEKYKFSGDKERFNEESLLELQVFQSFLFVTREPNQSNWLIDTFDYLDNLKFEDDKIDTPIFLKQLKKLDNNRCKTRNSESLMYGSIDRYWFWRLDYYLWENRKVYFTKTESFRVADKYIFRSNRSIEHIAPQQLKDDSKASITYETYGHSFGNLVMISSGQNSSLQNQTFEVKKAHVKEYINDKKTVTIESLKMLMLYEQEDWNDDNLIKHSDEMIQVLIKSFDEKDYSLVVSNLKKNLSRIDNDARTN